MDAALVAWARAVKRRTRNPHPVLWLFTDERRLADPLPSIERLPPGLCGVVFRHDHAAGRGALAARVARCCRARRITLVVAGDARLAAAVGAGVHLREGRWPSAVRAPGLRTASAHGRVGLRRALNAGATIIFLAPAFETPSHLGAPGLGPVRWARLAKDINAPVCGLGGINGKSIRRLGRRCGGGGGISFSSI